jgi:hypothetical protein
MNINVKGDMIGNALGGHNQQLARLAARREAEQLYPDFFQLPALAPVPGTHNIQSYLRGEALEAEESRSRCFGFSTPA